jgi:hypothetical protein
MLISYLKVFNFPLQRAVFAQKFVILPSHLLGTPDGRATFPEVVRKSVNDMQNFYSGYVRHGCSPFRMAFA